MNLAIDIVGARHGGAGVVAQTVLDAAMKSSRVKHLIVFCSPASQRQFEIPRTSRVTVMEVAEASNSAVARVEWQMHGLARAAARFDADIILGLSNGVCAHGLARSCVFLQQALPFAREALGTLSLSQRLRQAAIKETMRVSARLADVVVVQTRHMRDAVVEHFGIAADKIVVLAPVAGTRTTPRAVDMVDAFAAGPGPRVLYVGNDLVYKNVSVLEDARQRVGGTFAATVKHAPGDVLALGALDSSALEHAYAKADMLVMPSLAESFGLPLFEAMLRGVPVVACDLQYAHDVCGDAATYFAPQDAASLASAIRRVATDSTYRQACITRGKAYAAERLRRDDAGQLIEVCFDVASRGRANTRSLLRASIVKRAVDIAVAGSVLVATAPVTAAAAITIRARLGSPVLFRQERPGLGGEAFELVKFRTMRHPRPGEPESDASRLTTLGKLLRASSIDELPTLWNVLKGDMSLVGPRPLLMRYLPRYSPGQARRHEVKPGITGWAQVNGRNALAWRRKFLLDVWYVDNWSLLVDAWVLALTAWRVVAPSGISAPGHATMPEFTGEELSSIEDES